MSGPLTKPFNVRTSPRLRTLKLVGFLMIFVSGSAMFALYAKYEAEARWQRASEAVATDATERAARLQELLLRVDRTLSWFRAEDLSTADRIAVTVRMLHTERLLAPARTLFLGTASGRLVAASVPLPDGSSDVSGQPWFKAILASPAQPGMRATGCTRDPFGSEEGVVLYRAVTDHDTVAGYVGSFLPQSELAAIARQDDPANGTVNMALRTASGEAFGCRPAGARLPAPPQGVVRTWLSQAIDASPTLRRASRITNDQAIEPGGFHLVARGNALDTMSDEDWTALAYRASYVATSLLLIMALLTSMLNRYGRPGRSGLVPRASNPVAAGGDWMWELDDAGNLVGLAGNAPDHLLPPSGRPLAEMAGQVGGSDMRWDRLNAAICAKQAFEGYQVPFQMPGRAGLLTIFELSGQPVLASGGFWGTACLVSEESVARAAQPALAKAQLSVA